MICNSLYQPNPDFNRLYIFGAGGSGREVAWLAKQSWGDKVELVFLVDDSAYLSCPVNGISVVLVSDVIAGKSDRFVAALGDAALRRKAVRECVTKGLRAATLVHPRAEMSDYVQVGEGSIICAGSSVGTNVTVGDHVHVNLGCTISHDVCLGHYATLSPGVHVSGHVAIDQDVIIGTGANIINGSKGTPLIIGNGAIVAAGACVTKPVEPKALMAGVPAIRKR